jgi:hypothetical protein
MLTIAVLGALLITGEYATGFTGLQDLFCGSGMTRRTAATHGDACARKLIAHCRPWNAKLGTDLAEGCTLGVQVGCTLNLHRATVTSLSRCVGPPKCPTMRRRVDAEGSLALSSVSLASDAGDPREFSARARSSPLVKVPGRLPPKTAVRWVACRPRRAGFAAFPARCAWCSSGGERTCGGRHTPPWALVVAARVSVRHPFRGAQH